jgi:hypothetical protein
MDYSSEQLINAINGKSAKKGGLNVYEIREYLTAYNIDPLGDRKTLEYKLQQLFDNHTSSDGNSRHENDFIADTYVSNQTIELINKKQQKQNAKYMNTVHTEIPAPISGSRNSHVRGRGYVQQGMYSY